MDAQPNAPAEPVSVIRRLAARLAGPRALLRPLALAAGLAIAPTLVHAGPVEDYIAARNRLAAEVAAAVKAGENEDAVDKRSAAAVKDLQGRMTALLGPVAFKGTQKTPIFMPSTLVPEYLESHEPDGLLFSSDDYVTRFFVTPEPVFTDWLAARAKDADAPAVLREGVKGAVGSGPLYSAVLGADAAFYKYMDVPVNAGPDETVNAALGLFTQSGARNDAPNTIVFTRIAGGRVVVGAADVKVSIPALPACNKAWRGYEAKSKALIAAAEKSKNDEDPRWRESEKVEEEGAAAYRACFVAAAPTMPFFATATKQAESLLATARGQ